jgi:hypothetical protein
VALGLLAGALLPPAAAGVAAFAGAGIALLAAALGVVSAPMPTAGLAVLGRLDDAARPISDALRSSGLALAVAAGLLLLAVVALERADL